MKKIKRLDVPLRIKIFKNQAKELENGKFYTAALLYYSLYTEQLILVKYIQYVDKKEPVKAKNMIDGILQIKDKGGLTFGKTLEICKPILKNGIEEKCREIKKIRDKLLAHPFFVMGIDKNNVLKMSFYDVNNYRKIVRRIYKLVKTKKVLTFDDEKEIYYFLELGSPLSKRSNIEVEEFDIEQVLLRGLCRYFRTEVEDIESKFEQTLELEGPLGKYMK